MSTVKRFVIQEHKKADGTHWDLMFEAGPALQTYRLDLPPAELTNNKADAVKIFDHPLKFLTYEGSVNRGKGTVRIVEAGTYQLLAQSDATRQLRLNGNILKGKFTLTHIDGPNWQLLPLTS